MSESNFGKVLCALLSGAAVGAAVGILFAPAKGTVTRRKIAKSGRDLKNSVTDKLEDLVESAEEIIDEIKESANEYMNRAEDEIEEIEEKIRTKKAK